LRIADRIQASNAKDEKHIETFSVIEKQMEI
jgi:hypothetical protein